MPKLFRPFLFLILALSVQTASAAWVKLRAPTFSWLYDVTFVSATKGFIVGAGGTVLETADGGATWTKRKNLTDDTIRQIIFSDPNNGWILCERDIFNRGPKSSSYLMRTNDGGETWEKVDFSGGGRDRVTRLFFNSKGAGIAIGEDGVIYDYHPGRGTWDRQINAFRNLLLGGMFNDDRTATIVGGGGSVFYSDDGGSSWEPSSVSGNPAGRIYSVFFLNRSNGWIAGAGGTILQTMNAGRSWRLQASGVTADLTDIGFINSAEGFAVGADGTILHTMNAGNVWVQEISGIKHRLERIAFNGRRAVAVGFGGSILTNDGGSPPKLK